jgi:hypothetical protein
MAKWGIFLEIVFAREAAAGAGRTEGPRRRMIGLRGQIVVCSSLGRELYRFLGEKTFDGREP